MVRPKKEVPAIVEAEEKALTENLTLWDQLAPLLFNKNNLLLLLVLRIAQKQGTSLPFTKVGEYKRLGKSQKLAHTLDYLTRCGLVRRTEKGYALTERLGLSFTNFAEKFVKTLQKSISKQPWLNDLVDVIERIEELEEVEVKNSIKTKTF